MFFMAIAITTQAASRRSNPNYVALSSFQERFSNSTVIYTDTLSYLKTNFDTNKAFYIGKPISVLLGDLQLPVLSSLPYNLISNQVTEFSLDFISTSERFKRRENKGKIVEIFITFNQAIPSADIYALFQQIKIAYPTNIGDWTSLDNTFYGSRIIKDIQVYQVDFSQP